MKAYKIDQNDYHAQYRIFRSLTLSNNEEGFKEFFEEEVNKTPEIIELLTEDIEFREIISKPDIDAIIQNYLNDDRSLHSSI